MKVLPYCAVCGRKEERQIHNPAYIGKQYWSGTVHEFVPCVTLKDAEARIEVLELELARVKEELADREYALTRD